MHNLVPALILDNFVRGNHQGAYRTAVALFVDISGFSDITDILMNHGQHGAEVLANLMRAVFEPLVHCVYQEGGFITGFAGDAFTALFLLDEDQETDCLPAVAAAWRIQDRMAAMGSHVTSYGTFRISARVGLGTGDVRWGIVATEDRRRAAYYFQGSAMARAIQAEHMAGEGTIVIERTSFEAVGSCVRAEPLGDHFRLLGVRRPLPETRTVELAEPDIDSMASFYPRDLATLTSSGEFRQIAYLFVSLPTVRTETQLRIFMQTLFELQEHYGGLLHRLDFGDKGSNVLLFWGAPIAYENDVARALGFILDLQSQTSIPISAGITYRIAHAGYIGSALREEYTCYGRGVNLAARFMTSAPRGEIWVDEGVAHRAEPSFGVEYEGRMFFKGFAEAQKVYVLLERKELTEHPFYSGKLIGRQVELAMMRDFVAPLTKGHYAGMMVVRGEPGIGKSRLIHGFQDSQPLEDADVLWALCQSDEILRQSLNPFRYWLRRYFAQSVEQSDARNKRRFNRRIETLIKTRSDADLSRELDRTRTFLGALVDLHWPDSLYEQLDAQGRRENTLTGLVTLLLAESARQPVIILLEDVHWLDDESKAFLRQLDHTLRDEAGKRHPIAVIATARLEAGQQPLGEGLDSRLLELEQLSHSELVDLAQALLAGPLSQELADLLVERSEGNPFFAEQIVRFLQEEDLLAQLLGHWRIAGAQPEGLLPDNVRTVLVARLDRLSSRVKEVVQTAAILGREFDVRLLAQILQQDETLLHLVDQAEQAAVWSAIGDQRYIFRHSLLREAAYAMQLHSRRQALHSAAAEGLQALHVPDRPPHYGEIGHHLEEAGRPDEAADWYLRAAQRARSQGAMVEARKYYARILDNLSQQDTRRRWHAIAGQIAVSEMLGDLENCWAEIGILEKLAKASLDEELVAETYYLKGSTAHYMGDDRTALESLEMALGSAARSGNRRIEALAAGLKLVSLVRAGDMDSARTAVEVALTTAKAIDDDDVFTRSLNNVATYYQAIGDYGRAVDALTRQVEINRRQGNLLLQAYGLLNLAYNLLLLGQYKAALKKMDDSLTLTESLGLKHVQAYNHLNLGLVYWRLGDAGTARRELEAARLLARQSEDSFAQAIGRSYMGLALELAGAHEEALQAFREGRRLLDEAGAAGYAADALAGLCRCAMAMGDTAQASPYGSSLWRYLSEEGAGGLEFPILAYQSCAMLFDATGDAALRHQAVQAGVHELRSRAARISDPEWRRIYLEEIPEHGTMLELGKGSGS